MARITRTPKEEKAFIDGMDFAMRELFRYANETYFEAAGRIDREILRLRKLSKPSRKKK